MTYRIIIICTEYKGVGSVGGWRRMQFSIRCARNHKLEVIVHQLDYCTLQVAVVQHSKQKLVVPDRNQISERDEV